MRMGRRVAECGSVSDQVLGCDGRQAFATMGHAMNRILGLHRANGWEARQCSECGFWHVAQVPSDDPHAACHHGRPCSTGCTA